MNSLQRIIYDDNDLCDILQGMGLNIEYKCTNFNP